MAGAYPPLVNVHVSSKVYLLSQDPDDKNLDIIKMSGISSCRLRVVSWRVIFDREDLLKIIEIIKIGSRGDVYK